MRPPSFQTPGALRVEKGQPPRRHRPEKRVNDFDVPVWGDVNSFNLFSEDRESHMSTPWKLRERRRAGRDAAGRGLFCRKTVRGGVFRRDTRGTEGPARLAGKPRAAEYKPEPPQAWCGQLRQPLRLGRAFLFVEKPGRVLSRRVTEECQTPHGRWARSMCTYQCVHVPCMVCACLCIACCRWHVHACGGVAGISTQDEQGQGEREGGGQARGGLEVVLG